ncbi:unnamed protein product [Prorocentrum cordatum]|uniref:Uncharacterized protein n=1 Tax=Prorocentrum cordatum TaxID=2364126 RepID=A0ABN9RKZ4_9DINO|nr:unnamed protein product [Polarella glacialis]
MDPACPGSPGDAGATYRAWGFRKSFAGVWSSKSLRFYSDQKLSGRELHPSLGQDPHRMGGDVLLDGSGTVVLPYYSKTNTDRPSVEDTLLPLVEALDGQRRASRRAGPGPLRALQLVALGAAAVHGARWCEDQRPRRRPLWSALLAGGLAAAACLATAVAGARARFGPAGRRSWAVEPLALPAAPRAECKT